MKLTPSSPSQTGGHTAGACSTGQYENLDGDCVQDPTYATSWPAGATAHCGDGTYSFSQHRQGTCSHHGGIAG